MFHMGCDFVPGVCVQAVLSTGKQHVQVGEAAVVLFSFSSQQGGETKELAALGKQAQRLKLRPTCFSF